MRPSAVDQNPTNFAQLWAFKGRQLSTARAQVRVALVLAILATSRLLGAEPQTKYPVTLTNLRVLATTGTEFSRCTSGDGPEQCWFCRDYVCGHTEQLAYNDWSVSCSAVASVDGEILECEVAAQSIRLLFDYLQNPSQVTIQVPGLKTITFHEARPVHLYVDGIRFTNPADGPYLKMDFRADDGSTVDKHDLIDRMQSAYRITVEGWNVEDEKVSTVDLGEGLASAIQYCRRFATIAKNSNE